MLITPGDGRPAGSVAPLDQRGGQLAIVAELAMVHKRLSSTPLRWQPSRTYSLEGYSSLAGERPSPSG